MIAVISFLTFFGTSAVINNKEGIYGLYGFQGFGRQKRGGQAENDLKRNYPNVTDELTYCNISSPSSGHQTIGTIDTSSVSDRDLKCFDNINNISK